jgi:DNA-binding LacI/PurR family transcriptional regulator
MSGSNASSNIVDLAGRIRADIKQRALKPGDQYLNSADAAKQFQVSTHAANRALQLLAKRRVVTRKQRLGTVIAMEEDAARDSTAIDRIHLLVREDYFKSEGVLADGVVMGLQGEMPRVGIQFNFLPRNEERPYVEELVGQVLKADGQEAFVLVRASLITQRIVAQSGCPAVVHGTPYPSVEPLCSIDRDHALEAELLVEHLVKRSKAEKIVLLMRERLHAGDHLFLDAIHQEMGRVGLGHNGLILRCMPTDVDLVEVELDRILDADPKTPTGVICATEFLADIGKEVTKKKTSNGNPRHSVALMSFYRRPGHSDPDVPHLHARVTPEQIGADIANLLMRQVINGHNSIHATYPLELRGN